MLKLAIRNLLRQRTRSVLTLAAIVFGVIGLVTSGGFVRDILFQLGEAVIHSQSGHIQLARSGFFTHGSRKPEQYLIANGRALSARVAEIEGVEAVMTRVVISGLINNGRADLAVSLLGVEPDREAQLGSFISIHAGRKLADADRHGILVGKGVADALKLGVGDRVAVVAHTLSGGMNTIDLEVVGVFQTFSADFDARAAQISLQAAQDLLATSGVNTVVVALRDTADTDRIAGALDAMLSGSGIETKKWQQLNDFYSKTVTLYQTQFGGLRLIILLMVLLSVANSVNMSAFERTGEFGTMLSLGNRRVQVLRLILLENAMLGLLGGALGVVIGAVLGVAISAIGIPMPPPPNSNLGYIAQIRVIPSELLLGFGIGVLASVAATAVPARRILKVPVVDALRHNA